MFSLFSNTLPQITAESIKRAMDNRENFVILDVRTRDEYQEGHIKGSILLPVDEVKEKVTKILSDKDQKLYIYCRSGGRSAKAASEMKKLGYTNVHNMQGGMMAWENKGFPIVT